MDNDSPKSLTPSKNSNFCESRKEKDASEDIRGALKLEASTSTPLTLAGEEISIYVVIRNPFLVPVKIHSTETHIPVSIVDELGRKRARKQLKEDRRKEIKSVGKEEQTADLTNTISAGKTSINSAKEMHPIFVELIKFSLRLKFFLLDLTQPLIHFFQMNTGDRVAIAVSPEEEDSDIAFRRYKVNIMGSVDGEVAIASHYAADVDIYGNVDGELRVASQNGSKVNIYGNVGKLGDIRFASASIDDLTTEKEKSAGIVLQPGDSLVKHFVLKTTKWLFFPPINHTFQIQVRYEVDEKSHIDTLPFSINIRAPMRSSIVGAIIGGFFGHMARDSNNLSDLLTFNKQLLIGLLRTIIFSLIVIVAFARKSSVQQVVSVEDFWGGVFTGFLVGYTGEEFIKSILGNTTTAPK
ncbi:hypothetical protein A6769_30895 [Nostoc punctiforme NIES-2108]|uniref:Uncharacterized protein n=1 Tax=Nostoc punctiforme NIES-2108 TaxID=1356359 RepID=A0A367R4Q0_NOSPU|nr:hypothetical protein A6769_30895 [Nostoc punctiforme NIES-2108]